jgi:signal transduction histidine kinase
VPPPITIQSISADDKSYSPASRLSLPAHTSSVQISYSAVSLSDPEAIRFRYKLREADKDWHEVAASSPVTYRNLPPGSFHFNVEASDINGVWSDKIATAEFTILPAFHQTLWFRSLCVILFLTAVAGLYQLRLRQLARRFNMTLDARVSERTRIARELHDTLLQSFHGLLLRFQAVYEMLPASPAKQNLEHAIDQAAQAITEGRDAVQGLRASAVESNDLALAIRTFGEELAAEQAGDGSVVLKVAVEGTPRTLHPILRDEIYRIACEAVRNALRHAAAAQIEVELRYDDRQLRLRVRDDGKGIDPKFLDKEGRAGHYGLHGMRERAELIGGKLTVWSAQDAGAEVELSVPADRAYATSATRRSWFAEKLFGESVRSES